jgi:hypothetical protein
MRYPVYIISKGRWDSRHTVKSLDMMGVKYSVVVEDKEYESYANVIPSEYLLRVDNFSELGSGSIPVRNWVWDRARQMGAKRYWLLDDNIRGFERLNRNKRGKVKSGAMFTASEDFVDRFDNVAIAGFEYRQFGGGARRKKPPFKFNHRVYSCSLIETDLPYRWRGRYNEDTDLCLRMLKDGRATIVFNCFLQNKIATMSLKGGNTDTIYATGDNRREFSESLYKQHPDVVEVVWRYGRWHHDVDYRKFKFNDPKLNKEFRSRLGEGTINNYGMVEVSNGNC